MHKKNNKKRKRKRQKRKEKTEQKRKIGGIHGVHSNKIYGISMWHFQLIRWVTKTFVVSPTKSNRTNGNEKREKNVCVDSGRQIQIMKLLLLKHSVCTAEHHFHYDKMSRLPDAVTQFISSTNFIVVPLYSYTELYVTQNSCLLLVKIILFSIFI